MNSNLEMSTNPTPEDFRSVPRPTHATRAAKLREKLAVRKSGENKLKFADYWWSTGYSRYNALCGHGGNLSVLPRGGAVPALSH
jgi:hypothetical protein